VLGGRPGYEVTSGSVWFRPNSVRAEPAEALSFPFSSNEEKDNPSTSSGRTEDGWIDLLELAPDERAAAGLFLGFQYPVEIPGVSNVQFLRTALNAQRRARGEAEMSAGDFLRLARSQGDALGVSMDMLKRNVNVGFSGGEKKRNEMVQMALIDPKLAVLDETGQRPRHRRAARRRRRHQPHHAAPDKAVILITHYQRLLDIVAPDFVHVLAEGRIVRSGGSELAHELEREGYGAIGGMMSVQCVPSPLAGEGGPKGGWGVRSAGARARYASAPPPLPLPTRGRGNNAAGASPPTAPEAWRWSDLSALPTLAQARPRAGETNLSEPSWLDCPAEGPAPDVRGRQAR
jgi:Fe-S cluster assembly ATP-binding protein